MLLCNTKMENTKNSHISDQNLLKLNLDTYNSYFVFQTKKRQKMFNDVLLELLLILDSRFQYGHLHLECGNWYSIFGLPTLTQHRGWLLAQKNTSLSTQLQALTLFFRNQLTSPEDSSGTPRKTSFPCWRSRYFLSFTRARNLQLGSNSGFCRHRIMRSRFSTLIKLLVLPASPFTDSTISIYLALNSASDSFILRLLLFGEIKQFPIETAGPSLVKNREVSEMSNIYLN